MRPARDSADRAPGRSPDAPRGAGHSRFGRWLYSVLWVLCRTLGIAVFGFRVRFVEPLPATGGLLVLSTHQSHLDPLLLGLACDRRLSSMARSSLYRWKPFGAVITALDAIPVDREGSAVAAMKTVIRALEGGAAVVVFPEGTRTATGRPAALKSGFALIAKRARVPIVPVAIVGAYECWPRSRRLPRPGRIRLEFGRVIPAAEVAALDEQALVAACTRQLFDLDGRARAARDPRSAPVTGSEPVREPRGSGPLTGSDSGPV